MEMDVTYVFDEIVARHMERLIGSRVGIGGLPLTIGTIACLSLLDDERDEPPEGEPGAQENTLETLHAKLAELGLRDKEKAETLIQDMVAKGYILTADQGRISGGKPAESMARLMRSLFPKMPGMTLIAYFVQTIDEVLTGRKGIETAVAHFDQTLKMLGVPPKSAAPEKPKPVLKEERRPEASPKETRRVISPHRSAGETRTGVRIIGSSLEGVTFKLEAAPAQPAKAAFPEEKEAEAPTAPPEPVPPAPENAATAPDTNQADADAALPEPVQPAPETTAAAPDAAEAVEENPPETLEEPANGQEPPVSGPESAGVGLADPESAEGGETSDGPPPEKDQPEVEEASPALDAPQVEPDAPEENEEDLIEKEVAQFQDQLAAVCPLCKTGKVREQRTGTGRLYYKCSNKECNLVSWGKPHYYPCPICSNPFLVEVSEGEDGVKLRCPRGTCSYRCTVAPGGVPPGLTGASSLPPGAKPRKRLVRRRVVKRKK